MNKTERISLKLWYKNIIKNFSIDGYNYISLTVFLGIFIIFLVYWLFKGSSRKRTAALLGLCGSGKTQLFTSLCYGTNVITVTSIKESSGMVTLKSKKNFKMYDLPGHDRIRYAALDKVKSSVKALVFVVDSSAINEQVKDVAEFLYSIFCDSAIQSTKPRVLIVCNKQDVPTAKGANVVKSLLEREINVLRVSKSSQLKSVGESGNNNSFLGYRDEDFEFSHLKPIKVSFVEAVAENGSQIDEVEGWLQAAM